MAHKKTPAAGGAAGSGRWSADARSDRSILRETTVVSATDQLLLAQRIGQLRQKRALGRAALEAAAGGLIDRYPNCPRPVSLLVDRLTHARDLALWEGRA